MQLSEPQKKRRGFAAMSPEARREVARKGGQSVPAEKRSFARNRELAQEAGRRGGMNIPDDSRAFSKDRDLAAQAGRKGGSAERTTRATHQG